MRPLILLLLLAACAREAPLAPPAASFRDRAVPIGSVVRGTPSDLLGQWVVSEAFLGSALARPGSRVTLSAGPSGEVVWTVDGAPVATRPDGPGRFAGGPAGQPLRLWVVWVDDDFRTAAVGTPDGSLGWIMDRPGTASADRTRAARDVLGFSGYDLSRLAGA